MRSGFEDRQVADWFARRTFRRRSLDVGALAELKRSRTLRIGVALPALNEAATVGAICRAIRVDLVEAGIVDRLVVVDSGSEDETAQIARREGADVFSAHEILTGAAVEAVDGKGAALWASLDELDTEIVVWVDADIKNFDARFVTDLVGPLLSDDDIAFVKSFYDRPLETEEGTLASGGARVTELAARPLLNLLFPELAGIVQPLSGEYAGRRDVLARLPFFTGYGVDVGLLIDVANRCSLDAIAQVDLGVRIHRNQDLFALGRMAHQVMQAILVRAEDQGRIKLIEGAAETLVQFAPDPASAALGISQLPPLDTLPR